MIGQVVGNYRIVDRLGDGGMGSVYRAVDRMLDREVAIKVLRPELARQTSLVERFRQEAIALARLSHPNIAMLHGLEQHGDQLLMIMEYVRGDTLETIVQRSGRLAWSRACELCISVLQALDHAHDKGVVHRDIKPANIMLSSTGMVKVMDFGIARLMGRNRQTQFGHAVGTPMYMSPEQLRGHEVDGRTDLYAVAAVLFELVTGRMAFEADSDYALMMKQLNDPPPPPSSIVPDVPSALDAIVTKAMSKLPGDRHANAMTLAKELQRVRRLSSNPSAGVGVPATRLVTDTPASGALGADEDASLPGDTTDQLRQALLGVHTPASASATPHATPDLAATRLAASAPDLAASRPGASASDIAATRLAGAASADIAATRLAGAAPSDLAATRLAGATPPTGELAATRLAQDSRTDWLRDWRAYAAVGAFFVVAAAGVRTYRASKSGQGADSTAVARVDSSSVVANAESADTARYVPREDASTLIIPRQDPAPPAEGVQDSTSGSGSGDGRKTAPPAGSGGRKTTPPSSPPARTPEPVKGNEREGSGTGVSEERPVVAETRVVERGESATEAREGIRSAIREALSSLGDRNGAAAQSLLQGSVTSQWISLAKEGRVSASLSGSPDIALDGTRASATFDASVNVRSPFGANRRRPARFSAELQRSGGVWRVASIRPIGALSLD